MLNLQITAKNTSLGGCPRIAIFPQIEANSKKLPEAYSYNIPRIIFSNLTKIWGKRAFSDSLLETHKFQLLV